MNHWRHSEAEAHWAAVSQATQLAAAARAEDGRRLRSAMRVRLAARLVLAGIRLAGPAAAAKDWADPAGIEP